MENILEALSAPDRAIRKLIEDYGAGRLDLMDLGIADFTARKWIGLLLPRTLAPEQSVLVPSVGLPATVALVPVGEVARRYLVHGAYLRDAGLRGQMRLRATHLGWSDGGKIEEVRPITRRWRLGSAAALGSTGIAGHARIAA